MTRSTAAVCALSVVVFGSCARGPSTAADLVAKAYAENRQLPLRFPGAEHAPLTPRSRGGEPESLALLEAEARIARALDRDPDATEWLVARANTHLLRWNYEAARSLLRTARASAPDDIEVLLALAICSYESAEASQEPVDYAEAAELLATVADLEGRHRTTVLFNLAVIHEQLFSFREAERRWVQLLQAEPRGGWSEEARAHLEALRQKLAAHESWNPPDNVANGEPGDSAVFSLLSQESNPQPVLAAAEAFGGRNADRWLHDLISGERSPQAIARLVEAEKYNASGDPERAIKAADLALGAFERDSNVAGASRARYELLYAYQRSSLAERCLRAGAGLSAELERHGRYPWLESQVLLERASCANMAGDFASADTWAAAAVQRSSEHRFENQKLRGLGIRAGILTSVGNWREAWKLDVSGLRTFWEGSYSPARAYQFYYTMGVSAEQHGYASVARAFGAEAVPQILQTKNLSTQAMALFRLGNLDLAAGDTPAARAHFEQAGGLFKGVDQSGPLSLYRADGEIGMARVAAREGDPSSASQSLRSIDLRLRGVANQNVSASFLRAQAEVEQRAGNAAASERALRALAMLAEAGSLSLTSDQDRLVWTHDLDQAYRGWVRLLLDRGETDAALDVWEWYRAADVRRRTKVRAPGMDIASLEGAALPFTAGWTRERARNLKNSTGLTYVQMPDGIAAWRYDNLGVEYRWLPVPAKESARLAAGFAGLCAQPGSSTDRLRSLGRSLYDAVIGPMIGNLPEQRALMIDADGPVAETPFEALTTPDGAYLGDQREIVMSAGIYGYRELPPAEWSNSDSILAIGSPLLNPNLRRKYPPLSDAVEEASHAAALFPRRVLLTGDEATPEVVRRALPSASVFHFAGHAVSSPERTGLFLADGDPAGGTGGFWSAQSMSGLQLPRCRLTVLSACSTSAMGGWGITEPNNLGRALLAAGVWQVVASRWPVDSRATRQLMAEFYSNLKGGKRVTRALQQARASVRGDKSTSHPYYWSAFSVFGGF